VPPESRRKGAPAGDRDENVEDRPDRREDPVGRIEGRLLERGVPAFRAGDQADGGAAADDQDEEDEQDEPFLHG